MTFAKNSIKKHKYAICGDGTMLNYIPGLKPVCTCTDPPNGSWYSWPIKGITYQFNCDDNAGCNTKIDPNEWIPCTTTKVQQDAGVVT